MTADERADSDDERMARGAEMMREVYGFGPESWDDTPLSRATIGDLFGRVWSRPGLPVRDRRLMVLGVIAQQGRADVMETQVLGALRNGELDEEELAEIVLHLAYYVGWPNVTNVHRGVQAAIATWKEETGATR